MAKFPPEEFKVTFSPYLIKAGGFSLGDFACQCHPIASDIRDVIV